MTTAPTAPPVPASRLARSTGPSPVTLTGLEIRKSLSTRSGRAVALAAVLLAPLGILLASLSGDETLPAVLVLGFTGMLTALVLLALGVLSTAGEWGNRSIQTTFLLVPRRGRIIAAKVAAMTGLGAVLAALSVAISAAMLQVIPDPVTWDLAGRAAVTVVAASAAFAVIGAGIGAAVGNAPAALTGTYLTVLGVLPIVATVKPEISEKLDPVGAMITIVQHGPSTTPIAVITGWVVVSTVLGTFITRRRSVA